MFARLVAASLVVCLSGGVAFGADRLLPGQSLGVGESLTSNNGEFTLVYQSDGNVVLYAYYGQGRQEAMWSSDTRGQIPGRFVMQDDGNLVIYRGGDNWHVFATNTYVRQSRLILQDDGNLVIYPQGSNHALWATNTYR
jgi:hypothetical protein